MWSSRPSAGPGRGLRVALVVVDAFAALTAIAGGFAVAAGLDTFPTSWLSGTPFTSYVIPGLILAVVVGGSAAIAVVAVFRGPEAGARASIVAGVVMMGWIVGEALILNQPSRPSGSEVVYFAVGLAMALLGLMIVRTEHKQAI